MERPQSQNLERANRGQNRWIACYGANNRPLSLPFMGNEWKERTSKGIAPFGAISCSTICGTLGARGPPCVSQYPFATRRDTFQRLPSYRTSAKCISYLSLLCRLVAVMPFA